MNRQGYSDRIHDTIPFIVEGQVVDTSDPDQMGRLRVWVPSLDGESYDIEQLPWSEYASPLAGFTVDFPAGNTTIPNKSHTAYGLWTIPKIGATVLVFFLNGNPARRFYFASVFRLHRNRSMPSGRNTDFLSNLGPFGDAGDGKGALNPIQPAYDNLRTQFQGKIESPEAQSRGAFERQVAQPKLDKDGEEGYQQGTADSSYLDPQTSCWVTPGRHAIIMQDHPSTGRMRLKTAEGHQVIFDDANERIYVSTSKGNTWLELDQDGHVHVFASQSISLRAGKDINLFADENINMEAGRGVNVKANSESIKMSAAQDIHLNAGKSIFETACTSIDIGCAGTIKITSTANMDIHSKAAMKIAGNESFDAKTGGKMMIQGSKAGINGGKDLRLTAARIDLNGPHAGVANTPVSAECAEIADPPSVVPGFEPWTRPNSPTPRNPYWKP